MNRNRIASLRKEIGLNQRELSEKLGVAQATVSAWETGRNVPDNETFSTLAKLFHVTFGYIAGLEDIRKDIPLSEYELNDMHEREYDDLLHSQFSEDDTGLSDREKEIISMQILKDEFHANGKGQYFEGFLFNKACEYMLLSQRERAHIILKTAFPNAYRNLYNPD